MSYKAYCMKINDTRDAENLFKLPDHLPAFISGLVIMTKSEPSEYGEFFGLGDYVGLVTVDRSQLQEAIDWELSHVFEDRWSPFFLRLEEMEVISMGEKLGFKLKNANPVSLDDLPQWLSAFKPIMKDMAEIDSGEVK